MTVIPQRFALVAVQQYRRVSPIRVRVVRLPHSRQLLVAGSEQGCQFCFCVSGSEVFEDGDFPAVFAHDLHGCGPGSSGDFP